MTPWRIRSIKRQAVNRDYKSARNGDKKSCWGTELWQRDPTQEGGTWFQEEVMSNLDMDNEQDLSR